MTGTETTKAFQTRFEDLMIENGTTLRDIANDTGISRAALNNYANDKAEIGINNVVKLAKYFNVSADYLLGLSDAKTNDKDLQDVCDFTGLSIEAVEMLHKSLTLSLPVGTFTTVDYSFNERLPIIDKFITCIDIDMAIQYIKEMEKILPEEISERKKLLEQINGIKTVIDYDKVEEEAMNIYDKFGDTADFFDYRIVKTFEKVFSTFYSNDYKELKRVREKCDEEMTLKYEKLFNKIGCDF